MLWFLIKSRENFKHSRGTEHAYKKNVHACACVRERERKGRERNIKRMREEKINESI